MFTVKLFGSFVLSAAFVLAPMGCKSENMSTEPKRSSHEMSESKEQSLQQKSDGAIAEFKRTDPGLSKFFENAAGYAVLPDIGKGAVGIGGSYGEGVVYAGGKAIGTTTMTQASIGLQIGGEAFSEIIFFKDKAALESFKRGNFEMSAQASAVAAKAGVAATSDYNKGVAVFQHKQGGLMASLSVAGAKFTYAAMQ